MKKILLLLIPIIICGCEAKNENFTKECTKKINTTYLKDNEKIKVTYNNLDEVTKAVITRTYTSKDNNTIVSVKKSASKFNNSLAKSNHIIIRKKIDKENKYQIEYTLDVQNLTPDELDYFKLKKNSIKFFNRMKNQNYECKKIK